MFPEVVLYESGTANEVLSVVVYSLNGEHQ